MGSSARRTLAEQLGGALPDGIEALPDQHKQDIADALSEARHRQAAALAEAGEQGLKYVPTLLRGAVRKAVGL